jgi:hypothetical protein
MYLGARLCFWKVAVLDLDTMKRRADTEPRSVDDQVDLARRSARRLSPAETEGAHNWGLRVDGSESSKAGRSRAGNSLIAP